MKRSLLAFCRDLGLDCVGIAPAKLPNNLLRQLPHSPICPLTPASSWSQRTAEALLPSAQSIVVALFPYYLGDGPSGNLSRYAYSQDYHLLIDRYLQKITTWLAKQIPDIKTKICVDTTPLLDRYTAYAAGLGFLGDNHSLINPHYGSYVTIGSIITNHPFPPDTPLTAECFHCGRCRTQCPGQCFDATGNFCYETCKSFLTQKKSDLTGSEIAIIRKTPLIFGCDTCQDVCPHNQNIPITPLWLFQKDPILSLQAAAISHLSNRQFEEKYGDRSFSWRGKKILLRNLSLISDHIDE